MTSPADCAERFPDDPCVGDDIDLLRRIPRWHFIFDKTLNRMRPSSAAFDDDEDGDPMSVYRRDVIESEGDSVDRVMRGHGGYALAFLTAGQFRSKQQAVFPDPLPEESAHAKICGPKTKSTLRWFAKRAQWAIEPPD